jgi:hypothetical protein
MAGFPVPCHFSPADTTTFSWTVSTFEIFNMVSSYGKVHLTMIGVGVKGFGDDLSTLALSPASSAFLSEFDFMRVPDGT